VTSSKDDEVLLRREDGRRGRQRNMASSLGTYLVSRATSLGNGESSISWPSARYRKEPAAFFREVLGVEPWSKQVEILEAVRDHPRVAVKSGHKVSKSHSAAGLALWFFCSFEDARVVMTSVTARQVDRILWRELRMMHARCGRCVACKELDKEKNERREPPGPRPCPHSAILDGEPGQLARTGLQSPDFREIVGFTAREAEAVAGVSGKNLIYVADEASGIPDLIFEAIEGNRAGGARIVMFSNPTRTEGEFFEAFDSKKELYKTVTVSSEDTPNVTEGREVIPGLATREWVEEKKREWGVDSPLYKIRVKGEFVLNETGKVLSVHVIAEAEKRWYETPEDGRLHIGLDPAGSGVGGDETVFALRRGLKVLGLLPFRGVTEEGHVVHVRGIVKAHYRRGEPLPIVKVDREGAVGAKVFAHLRADLEGQNDDHKLYELVGVRSSERAFREPTIYDRVRDELWAALALWFKEGGAIPEDTKLAKELHTLAWLGNIAGRQKVTSKDDLKKILGRSPDRADAVCLAVWEVPSLDVKSDDDGGGDDAGDDGGGADPYAVPGGIDPYNVG